jgi:TetR/AcrR family transcriptional regulator, repressor for uid operon
MTDIAIDLLKPETGNLSRAEKRGMQEQRILDAAKKCFVRSGFRGASMHDICKEADMSPGALYRYFPSKEAIIEAIAENDRAQDAEILSNMIQNPNVLEGLVSATMAHIRHVHESGFSALFTEIKAEGMRNEAVRNCCETSMRQVHDGFHKYLQHGIDTGQIAPEQKLDAVMAMFMAIGEGLILNDLPSRGIPMDDIEQLIRNAMTANLKPTGKAAPKH